MRVRFENNLSATTFLSEWFWLRIIVGICITAFTAWKAMNLLEFVTGIYFALSIIYRFPSRWSFLISAAVLVVLLSLVILEQRSLEAETGAYALSYLAIGACGRFEVAQKK